MINYRDLVKSQEFLIKKGVNTGLMAVHSINSEQVPVWTVNLVLMEYGTGSVIYVTAHNQRDYEFVQTHN